MHTRVAPAATVGSLVTHWAREDPGLDALVTPQRAITFSELDATSSEMARRLLAAGVSPGDRVGLLAPNGIRWVCVAMAVARMGAVLVPLSTLLRPAELIDQLRTAAVSTLVLEEEFRNRRHGDELEGVLPGLHALLAGGGRHAEVPCLQRVVVGDPEGDLENAEVLAAIESAVSPGDDFTVVFTSGSRGDPKGVIHTHHSAIWAAAAGVGPRVVGRRERLYVPMPLFWVGGLATGLVSVLVAGATLLTEAIPEPRSTLAFLERERATLFRGWPDQAAALAADPAFAGADLSRLGDASLGAILPPQRRPAPGARPNLFGMTETFGPYCGDRLDVDLPKGRHGSCGRPFAGVEIQIADPESGDRLPAGERGEIRVRGPNLMRGICGRTREEVFEPDGFYRTGDLGHLDDAGYLWVAGRLDDMFKVRGATVYPAEVEAALRSIPEVLQAHVCEVVAGSAATSEVGAFVVSGVEPAAIESALRERLSSFKVPTRWLVVAEATQVPTLSSGKVDPVALRRRLESAR